MGCPCGTGEQRKESSQEVWSRLAKASVVKLRIHLSVSVMMSGLWLSVRSLNAVTCSGVSMERVLRVSMRFSGWVGSEWGWMSPQRSSVAVSKER